MITCAGCGAQVPEETGPTHRYLLVAPACWRMYGEVLARRLAARAEPPDRYPVDAYAVQHPGVPGPQSSQSVISHLVSLGMMIELAASPQTATRVMSDLITARKGRFSWLEPPASRGRLTVADVVRAGSDAELDALVGDWAKTAWAAWAPYHPIVRECYPARG